MKRIVTAKFKLHQSDVDKIKKVASVYGITPSDFVMIAVKKYLTAVQP